METTKYTYAGVHKLRSPIISVNKTNIYYCSDNYCLFSIW